MNNKTAPWFIFLVLLALLSFVPTILALNSSPFSPWSAQTSAKISFVWVLFSLSSLPSLKKRGLWLLALAPLALFNPVVTAVARQDDLPSYGNVATPPDFSELVLRGVLPGVDDIKHVESLVKMPAGAKSIASYTRFYSIKVENGRQVIWGLFLLTNPRLPPPTVHIVSPENMPAGVNDGGCLQVNLFYDLHDAKITYVGCNGIA